MSVTRVSRFAFKGVPAIVAPVRHKVVNLVRSWVLLDSETADSMELVVGELVSNAVLHVGGLVTVAVQLTGCALLIEVYDGDGTGPQPRSGDVGNDESGMGLHIIAALTTRYGWGLTPRGKRVWAVFELPVVPEMRTRTRVPRGVPHVMRSRAYVSPSP